MIPQSNIYLAPDYKHLAKRAVSLGESHTVEISHRLANVTLPGPDQRTERNTEKE